MYVIVSLKKRENEKILHALISCLYVIGFCNHFRIEHSSSHEALHCFYKNFYIEIDSHCFRFVYKVVMEIAEKPNEQFEFYGEPRLKKKEAAEHAAQGALWYLKHEGYTWD